MPICYTLLTKTFFVAWAPGGLAEAALHSAQAAPAVTGGLGLALVALLFGALWWRRRARRRGQQYATLFAAAPDGLMLVNRELRIVEANEAACQLFEVSERRMKGRSLDRLLGPEEDLLPSESLGEGAVETVEAARKRASGERQDLSLRLKALKPGGNGPAYLATVRDVTEEAEETRLFKAFHRKIVDDLPIEFAVLSPKGEYLFANRRVVESEQARAWLMGKTDFDFCQKVGLHPEVALRRRTHRRRAMASREQVHFEEQLPLPPDATMHHFMRYYTPVFDPEDEVFAVVSYALDVTDLRRAEAQLETAWEEAERFARLKTSFLDNVGHEFRTPLTAILSAAQILEDEGSGEAQELVGIIDRNARRLENLLSALHDLADFQAENRPLQPRVLDVADAVERVAEELKVMAQEKGIFLRTSAICEEAFARLDPEACHRVLHSLIGNAVKFTGSGGVFVEVDGGDGQVHVRVMDTGVGIREEYLPRLFEAFEQESTGLARQFEGVGVGLAVVRRLVDLMDGTVTVDSAKGEGSTFTLSFPAVFQDGDTPVRPHVLVVEDNPADQQLMRHLLDSHVRLSVVEGLDAARLQIEKSAFDAILLNVALGEEKNAVDLVVRLQKIGGEGLCPLLAVDAFSRSGGEASFRAAGFDGYVPKPLEKETLLNAIADALAQVETPAA